MVDKSIIAKIRQYLSALSAHGIHSRQAILFGSFARNEETQWSDIDLVVIAPEFDSPHSSELVKCLWRATLAADNRIEPIPCGEQEWEKDDSRAILEVARQEGIRIAA
ncbi:MAG: nucleotidyltransferase domain-containing protein [Candidatus Sumerlaeota bacterium]|nr:nucleotidyltransferase domain-containing protein [Candidatus Sumerlaeota bacterium]